MTYTIQFRDVGKAFKVGNRLKNFYKILQIYDPTQIKIHKSIVTVSDTGVLQNLEKLATKLHIPYILRN